MVMRGTRSEGGVLDVESGVVAGVGVESIGRDGVESGALGAQLNNASTISVDTIKQTSLMMPHQT